MQIKIWIILNIKILNFKALCLLQIQTTIEAKLELETEDKFSTKCQKVLIFNFSWKKIKSFDLEIWSILIGNFQVQKLGCIQTIEKSWLGKV